jgi:hypothetical protein
LAGNFVGQRVDCCGVGQGINRLGSKNLRHHPGG